MKKTKLVTSLVLVLVLTCCMMATSFAATKITYQCNGNDAGRYRTDSHSYGDGLNCDVMMRQSYGVPRRHDVSVHARQRAFLKAKWAR